jgi:hypothetical protein
MPIQEGKVGEGKPTYKSYRWHYTFMTKTANIRKEQWGLPRPLHGVRHMAIRRANSAQTNITAEISAVEDCIVPRAALTAAEQEIAQLKSDKGTLRKDVKDARDVADKAIRVLESTKALLDTANERLVENKLGPVMATADGTAGTEDALSETNANNIMVDSEEEDPTHEGEQEELCRVASLYLTKQYT